MKSRILFRALSGSACVFVLGLGTNTARAAGWDTPIVHTARYQAMGGTAIGAVKDASASFHNPAGYSGIHGLQVFGSMSLLLGHLTTSPGEYPAATSVKSDLVIAPFPLLAAGYRVHEWITVGVGAYPVASGAASYSYPTTTTGQFEDELRAVFFELSPGVSINIPEKYVPGRLAIGVGYRATAVTFDRYKATDDVTQLDLSLSGWNFTGVRVGVQYSPIPELRLGAVVRNKIEVDASADEGTGFFPLEDIELGFILPLKVGIGARLDVERIGVGLDYEYAAQHQNDVVELSGTIEGADSPTTLPNHFRWQDGHTVRAGFEYRTPFRTFTLPLRVGYVFDSKVGNERYPTAFGTPPAFTQSFTYGLGFVRDKWQVNAAGAYRYGKTKVTEVADECVFCGAPGTYAISLMGFYLDASVDFDL